MDRWCECVDSTKVTILHEDLHRHGIISSKFLVFSNQHFGAGADAEMWHWSSSAIAYQLNKMKGLQGWANLNDKGKQKVRLSIAGYRGRFSVVWLTVPPQGLRTTLNVIARSRIEVRQRLQTWAIKIRSRRTVISTVKLNKIHKNELVSTATTTTTAVPR